MQNVNLDCLVDGDLFCPKCGKQVIDTSEEFSSEELCEHVLFVATDEGFEYSKNEEIVDSFENGKDFEDMSFDKYFESLDINNGFMITMAYPMPFGMGIYVGFKYFK